MSDHEATVYRAGLQYGWDAGYAQAMRDMEAPWSKEWPTEPGLYWFYGRRFHDWVKLLYYVKVGRDRHGIFHDGGGFNLLEGQAEGVWQPVLLPILPEEES